MHCSTNFRELETRLKQQNPNLYDAFTTDSDCEVLLHLYKETGAYVHIFVIVFYTEILAEKKECKIKSSFLFKKILY